MTPWDLVRELQRELAHDIEQPQADRGGETAEETLGRGVVLGVGSRAEVFQDRIDVTLGLHGSALLERASARAPPEVPGTAVCPPARCVAGVPVLHARRVKGNPELDPHRTPPCSRDLVP
jgi:hypothetical protein